jgi:hypothetical protein
MGHRAERRMQADRLEGEKKYQLVNLFYWEFV